MEFLTQNAKFIDNDFQILCGNGKLTSVNSPSDDADLVEIANYLWMTEKTNNPLDSDSLNQFIDYLSKEWKNPHSGIFDKSFDVYTSNIALVYAAIEIVKNNHRKNELQQYLTQIKDFVFENLLENGELVSSVTNRNVTPDELLCVWPFNLFSAEDLVLVQAADNISENYANITLYWKKLYIHYLLSRFYYDDAETLYRNCSKENDPSGIGRALDFRFLKYESKFKKSKNDVVFQHTTSGNDNRYSPLDTQRIPKYPEINKKIYFPVRIDSAMDILRVDLVIERNNKIEKFSLTEKDGIWYTNIILKNIGDYEYWFEAVGKGFIKTSKKFYLNLVSWLNVKRLSIEEVSANSLALLFNEDNISGRIKIDLSNEGLKFSLEKVNEILETKIPVSNDTYSLNVGELHLTFSGNTGMLKIIKGRKTLLVHSIDTPSLRFLRTESGDIKELAVSLLSNPTEKFWGFGERYNDINQAGNIIDNYVFNQYRDQGIRTYMPMPLYISNEGYGLLLSSRMYSQFDLSRTPKGGKIRINIELGEGSKGFIYLTAGTTKTIIQGISSQAGKASMLPTWAMGLWMSSNNWDRQSVVNKQLELANKYKIPATVFVLEQWSDEATYYMFNDSEYANYSPEQSIKMRSVKFPSWGRWPDPKKMINNIHKNGMKLILWQIPILKEYPLGRNIMLDKDKEYAIDKGYIVKNKNGKPYYIPEGWFTNALVWDPTSKKARDWWFSKRQYLIDMGVDGFKTDGGECIFGDSVQFANGSDGKEMRNQYPLSYIGAYYNFLRQNNGITFSRSGYTGAQLMPAHWAGDERSTFSAFKRSLKAGLNASVSGIIFWGWDFSGFNGSIPTSELYIRATEMATFIPIMQYHAESKAQYNQDRTPWNIQSRTGDKSVIPIFKEYADLRMNLLPYIYDESNRSVKESLPLMKPLFVEYPDDSNISSCYDEYLFGDSLLIAPIIVEKSIKRDVYLPKGKWCNFFSNEVVDGNRTMKDVPSNIDMIPVYVRENSAILMNTHDGKIMSDVGNNINSYDQPLLKIFAVNEFTKEIKDHLGNKVLIKTQFIKNNVLNVRVFSDLKNLRIQLLDDKNKNLEVRYSGGNNEKGN